MLASIVRQMNRELEAESSMAIGKVVRHPDGRKVKIESGYFLDPIYHRVSNHWTWREVRPDGTLGPKESGYGW